MVLFINSEVFSPINSKVGENLAYGYFNKGTNSNTLEASWTAPSDSSVDHAEIKINGSFSKGEQVTISAYISIISNQDITGIKAELYDANYTSFDDNEDGNLLIPNKWSSKTITAKQDFPASMKLLIYAGGPTNTQGNTIHIYNLKVERGAIATPWIPSPLDYAIKPDIDNLQDQINQLKSKLGGVKPHYRLYYAASVKEVA